MGDCNEQHLTPQAFLQELGERVRNYRISYPLTQQQLADRSGVSLRSIQRFEKGEDIQATNLFRILDALGLADHCLLLVPDVTDRPSAHLPSYKKRQRVRSEKKDGGERSFRWGDEK